MDMPNDVFKMRDGYVACKYCQRELTPEEIEDYGDICEDCVITDMAVTQGDA